MDPPPVTDPREGRAVEPDKVLVDLPNDAWAGAVLPDLPVAREDPRLARVDFLSTELAVLGRTKLELAADCWASSAAS